MYIGHTTLENFISKITPDQVLYLNFLEDLIPGRDGIDLLCYYLLLQTSSPNRYLKEPVFYWRMVIGDLLAPGGTTWEHERTAVRKARGSARIAIKRYLQEQPNAGRVKEGAVISMPRDLKLVAGRADCLAFDRATKLYRLKELAEQRMMVLSPT